MNRKEAKDHDTKELLAAQVAEQRINSEFLAIKKEKQMAYDLFKEKGWLGFHQFYLKNKRRGWLMCICTLSIIGIPITFWFMVYDYWTLETQVEKFNQRLLTKIRGDEANDMGGKQ